MEYRECAGVRTIFARFDEGEDLILALKKCAADNEIKSGWFSVIGGLKEFAYGLYEGGEYRKIKKSASHCFELLPTFGNITMKEGEILIHAHIALADESEGAMFGGHLMEGCKVYPFAEVVMQEVDIEIGRAYDPAKNLWPIKF